MKKTLPHTVARTVGALVLFAVTACGDASGPPPPATGVDLDRLFAQPTAAEIAAVEADWAARAPAAVGVNVEHSQPFPIGTAAMQLRIVSHTVDGATHYGAVLAPLVPPAGRLPLLLYLHGGDAGVAVEEVVLVAGSAGINPASAVWVIPSFRSEQLRLGSTSWRSDGAPSPWDRDVDDTLGLLAAAAALVPQADRACVASIGFSRGAGVGLLLSAREPRVRGTVAFFGPTDFFGSFMRDVAEETLRGRPRDLPGMDYLNRAWLQPLRTGQVSYEEARLALLRRSAARFAGRLGPVQLHHGTADDIVPISQAQALVDAMTAINRGPPLFEAFFYPGVGHNPFIMAGASTRVERFLSTTLAACPQP